MIIVYTVRCEFIRNLLTTTICYLYYRFNEYKKAKKQQTVCLKHNDLKYTGKNK